MNFDSLGQFNVLTSSFSLIGFGFVNATLIEATIYQYQPYLILTHEPGYHSLVSLTAKALLAGNKSSK